MEGLEPEPCMNRTTPVFSDHHHPLGGRVKKRRGQLSGPIFVVSDPKAGCPICGSSPSLPREDP